MTGLIQKTIPHSRDAEMMVLGSMLNSLDSFNISCDSLEDSDFFFTEHKTIFRSLQRAYKLERVVEVYLIAEDLKRAEQLEGVGGVAYLVTLAQFSGVCPNIEEFIQIVKDDSTRRKMLFAGQTIQKMALESPDSVEDALSESQKMLFEISKTASSWDVKTIGQIIEGAKSESGLPFLEEIQIRQEEHRKKDPDSTSVTGISTGFTQLDKMINGLNNSNLIILACRPAMGKTALSMNIAEHVCFKQGLPVGIFSLEMSADQLVHRLLCSQAEVSSDRVKTGALGGIEYQHLVSATRNISEKPLIIDDEPGLKINVLRARARRMKELYGIRFLIIDYLQLLSSAGSSRGYENRQTEVSEISRTLKNIARELNIPVLCCAQLSRKVDERPGHRPVMSDLRESGSIEQDADIVMFLFRNEYYDPFDKPGQAEIIIGKNRHGGVGSVHLNYKKEMAKFENSTPIREELNRQNFKMFDAT